MEKLVKNVREWSGVSKKESGSELNRSQYSLVSCGELSAEAVQLWLSLPEEVKYDPSLAPFRRLSEREHVPPENEPKRESSKRLPLVNSAPLLNNNLSVETENDDQRKSFVIGDEIQPANGNQGVNTNKKESKMSVARHYTKMTLLLACWVFFTLVFLMYNVKEHIIRNTSVTPGELKNYTIQLPNDVTSVLVQLSGPFLTENEESMMNSSQLANAEKMEIWLEKWILKEGADDEEILEFDKVLEFQKTEKWTVILVDESQIDFNDGEPRSQVLQFTKRHDNGTEQKRYKREAENETAATEIEYYYRQSENRTTKLKGKEQPLKKTAYAIVFDTNAQKTVPISFSYKIDPVSPTEGVIYACLLLSALYIMIIFEVINRTMAAVLVSTLSLATLALVGERPTVEELVSWLDVETLLLLFSMMLLVAIMAETGMFDYLAVYTFEVTKGKLWPLITTMCVITALLSTFLDNVTTVLLMTPVTIRLCEVMDLDPIPILMSMVLFTNIGGTATPVGDPPNVILASNKAVVESGVNFANFTLHMSLGCILVALQTYFQLRFMFRDTNKLRLKEPRDIQELRLQITIWRRATDSLPHLSKDQLIVRERLEHKIRKLQTKLELLVKESSKRACPKDTYQSTLDEMRLKYPIRNKVLLIKCIVAITFVVGLFFLHSIPEMNRVSLGWTALLGAILLLVLADREDLEPILHKVEWSTLLFFAALFVLMEALSKLGLIAFIGGVTENVILQVDESARLGVALILMLWVSGLTSAFIDNIPLTTMMVRVVTSLGSKPSLNLPLAPLVWALSFGACLGGKVLNLPLAPLVWALSFGACLGGNGTLIGASANVVCAGVAEQHGYKFTFMQFFKIGFPLMIGHLVVATVYLMVCHVVFNWH